MRQQTIKTPISCSGIGVHSGAGISMTLMPGAPDTGVWFKRMDVAGQPLIRAHWDNVVDTRFSTKIANDDGVFVSTIEHLMAALAAAHIDNILVELSGPEVPIMDGSSAPFVFLLESAGIVQQSAFRRFISIQSPVEVRGDNGAFVRLLPADTLSFDISIDFGGRDDMAAQQYCVSDISSAFKDSISSARTYGFYEDAKKMWDAGLAKGASLENTVVFDGSTLMNEGGMRHEDECVRHKVLDALGDLSLAGLPIQGAFVAHNCGHFLNNSILKELFQRESAWEIVARDRAVPVQHVPEVAAIFASPGKIAYA